MLEPVELNLYPSSFDCLSWSTDGDLAIALGEYVYVLIPQISPATDATSNAKWTSTKFRANLFTNKDWPMTFPQASATFSIGAEQSSSSVVDLSWSPAGLGRYNRPVLAVLTSNLILSLWELADGQSKWVRVMIVNHAAKGFFAATGGYDEQTLRRKQNVRSFCWGPLCAKSGGDDIGNRPFGLADTSLLAIGNDCNDLTLIRIRNDRIGPGWSAEVVSHNSLSPPTAPSPHTQKNTLFGMAMNSLYIISRISWSAWSYNQDEQGRPRYSSPLAVIYGTEVRVYLIHTRPEEGEDLAEGNELSSRLDLRLSEPVPLPEDEQFLQLRFKDRLHWVPHKGTDGGSFSLAAAFVGGYGVITFDGLLGPKPDSNLSLYQSMRAGNGGGMPDLQWENITGMTSIPDPQTATSTLHIVNQPSSFQSITLPIPHQLPPPNTTQATDLHHQIESFRSRFDLDHDLAGMSQATTWGLATCNGWLAACFTLHPTDMIEYITTAKEHATVVFAPPHQTIDGQVQVDLGFPWRVPGAITPETTHESRAAVLAFMLDEQHWPATAGPWDKKLLYAALCCVITCHPDHPRLLRLAKSTAQYLARETGLDLSREINTIEELEAHGGDLHGAHRRTIPPQPADLRMGAGGEVFEFCEVCGEGIEWYAAEEAQCAQGHVFGSVGFETLRDLWE
ncbi:hypothetical protein FQN51_000516 [Onygenales sp. PD_10]|nr:hypothetical protein FQN51_000516 [Onygenales sp. PD_10]